MVSRDLYETGDKQIHPIDSSPGFNTAQLAETIRAAFITKTSESPEWLEAALNSPPAFSQWAPKVDFAMRIFQLVVEM